AVPRVVVERGELTLHVPREHLVTVARLLRDEPSLAFQMCLGVSGVHYPWDFFGVVFEGHPALTRIEMPDDWKGHPQRKDYPLGGIPVEYRGATVPPP